MSSTFKVQLSGPSHVTDLVQLSGPYAGFVFMFFHELDIFGDTEHSTKFPILCADPSLPVATELASPSVLVPYLKLFTYVNVSISNS